MLFCLFLIRIKTFDLIQMKSNYVMRMLFGHSNRPDPLTKLSYFCQQNLELLVRKQRKARQYGELKAGRYSLQFRQESVMDHETQKQKSINSDLASIVESLKTDFPILETPVTQILNTLRSPAA